MTRTESVDRRDDAPVHDRPDPRIDELGVLRHADKWLPLTPVQEAIMRCLVGRVGQPVATADIATAAWPDGGRDPHAINVHLHRLRPRLKELGLKVHTLRGRGFLLELNQD